MKTPPPSNYDYYRILGIAYACLLFITGGLCILTGFMAEDIYIDFGIFSTLNFLVMSSILSIAGNFALFTGILCLFAAFKRNKWLITVIGLMLGIAISMQLSASITGHSFNGNTPHAVERKMYESLKYYDDGDLKLTRTWDRLHKKFQCCGVNNVTDWAEHKGSIPESCCVLIREDAEDPYKCGEYYAGGCALIFSQFFGERSTKVSQMGIVAAIIQFTGLCAILLAHSIFEYLDKKDRDNDMTFLKANAEIFTIDPYYTKLDKDSKFDI